MSRFLLRTTFACLLAPAMGASGQQLLPPPSLDIVNDGSGTFTLSWDAKNLRPYELQASLDLVNWMPLGGIEIGTGSVRTALVSSNADKMFFRHREGATRRGLFTQNVIPQNDDLSSPSSNIGFEINLFGNIQSTVYVNNNGNLTFGTALNRYTPTPLQDRGELLIAAFWADVDTSKLDSATNPGEIIAREVTYGVGTIDGRNAFGANYFDVPYYKRRTQKLNTFQIILIQRTDTGDSRNFDVEMNYDQVDWETGDESQGSMGLGGKSARAGLTNGIDSTIEISGSGVNGAFLDHNTANGAENYSNGLIYRSRNSVVPGRFVFEVRNGNVLGALQVDAGPDVLRSNGPTYQLQGTASDPNGGTPTVMWNVLSGPTDITFSNPTSLAPVLTNPFGRTAVIQLTITSNSDPSITAADIFRIN